MLSSKGMRNYMMVVMRDLSPHDSMVQVVEEQEEEKDDSVWTIKPVVLKLLSD